MFSKSEVYIQNYYYLFKPSSDDECHDSNVSLNLSLQTHLECITMLDSWWSVVSLKSLTFTHCSCPSCQHLSHLVVKNWACPYGWLQIWVELYVDFGSLSSQPPWTVMRVFEQFPGLSFGSCFFIFIWDLKFRSFFHTLAKKDLTHLDNLNSCWVVWTNDLGVFRCLEMVLIDLLRFWKSFILHLWASLNSLTLLSF